VFVEWDIHYVYRPSFRRETLNNLKTENIMLEKSSLLYGLNKPSDLMRKLRRDSDHLHKEAIPDNIFNFVIRLFVRKNLPKNG